MGVTRNSGYCSKMSSWGPHQIKCIILHIRAPCKAVGPPASAGISMPPTVPPLIVLFSLYRSDAALLQCFPTRSAGTAGQYMFLDWEGAGRNWVGKRWSTRPRWGWPRQQQRLSALSVTWSTGWISPVSLHYLKLVSIASYESLIPWPSLISQW